MVALVELLADAGQFGRLLNDDDDDGHLFGGHFALSLSLALIVLWSFFFTPPRTEPAVGIESLSLLRVP